MFVRPRKMIEGKGGLNGAMGFRQTHKLMRTAQFKKHSKGGMFGKVRKGVKGRINARIRLRLRHRL